MSMFQIAVTGVFVALVMIGIGVFAAFGGFGGNGGVGRVVIWGTLPAAQMENVIGEVKALDKSLSETTYQQIPAADYEGAVINAIAGGRGPDLVLITPESFGVFADKLLLIPYGAVSQGEYANSYIDEGFLFLTSQGSYALPFLVDPLVMYWNRDMLTSAGVAQPPAQWNDLLTFAPKVTSLDASSGVRRSAVALGTWNNIRNAKAILSTLLMQAGDAVTMRDQTGALRPVFGRTPEGTAEAPAQSALRFYTDFGNPSKATYSWNRSLPRSDDAFAGGQLALYFGFASEYAELAARNPNLRIGVSAVPQLASGARMTYGRLYAFAVPRGAMNVEGAFAAARALSAQHAAASVVKHTGLPPARRDVALDTSQNAAMAVFVQSALASRGWLDPSYIATDTMFKTMIESVLSGRDTPSQAVADGMQVFDQLLPYQ